MLKIFRCVKQNISSILRKTYIQEVFSNEVKRSTILKTNKSSFLRNIFLFFYFCLFFQIVTNWNGDRAHLEREVNNERREERKRHFDPDDEEMDRGRTKKIKCHREYESRSNPGFNPFQEYSNDKSWNRSNHDGSYRRYNDTSSHCKSRHGNHRQPYYKYHSYSRDHCQRR